jgi:hypothetical protein
MLESGIISSIIVFILEWVSLVPTWALRAAVFGYTN